MNSFSTKDIVSLLDLTALHESDDEERIRALCAQAGTKVGNVAAVCVYPHLVTTAHHSLTELGYKDIAVATVINFPDGQDSKDNILIATQKAIQDGATEIDVVLPYQALLDGDETLPGDIIHAVCHHAHENNTLVKVILETGVLQSEAHILKACEIAIDAGADFLKTSTGKSKIGATLEAVDLMLEAISAEHVSRKVGIKISGGVRTRAEACRYLNLIASRVERDWITKQHIRIGASSLLDDLLNHSE